MRWHLLALNSMFALWSRLLMWSYHMWSIMTNEFYKSKKKLALFLRTTNYNTLRLIKYFFVWWKIIRLNKERASRLLRQGDNSIIKHFFLWFHNCFFKLNSLSNGYQANITRWKFTLLLTRCNIWCVLNE